MPPYTFTVIAFAEHPNNGTDLMYSSNTIGQNLFFHFTAPYAGIFLFIVSIDPGKSCDSELNRAFFRSGGDGTSGMFILKLSKGETIPFDCNYNVIIFSPKRPGKIVLNCLLIRTMIEVTNKNCSQIKRFQLTVSEKGVQ